jgi:hypothetical protein
MFGGKNRKPIDQWTNAELRASLIFGTFVWAIVLVATFFGLGSFRWIGFIFCGLWIVGLWYQNLSELNKRKHAFADAPQSR